MKVLLFGRTGQVGWELQRALAPIASVTAPDTHGVSQPCGDLTDSAGIEESILREQPDVIVNAAAYTAVDRAETEPELARAVNATAPGAMAQAAARCGTWLVHYSTDYVFDGSGREPWEEDDPTGPLNEYGRTKLEGERLIRASGCRHLILRTSWVYSGRGRNFARTMLKLAAERDELSIVDDQHGAPTGAELIADATVHVVLAARRHPNLAGTYHLVASGETTWYGFGRHVIERARAAGWPVRVSPERIRRVSTSAFKSAAARPANSRLNSQKIRRTFDLVLPHWTAGVDRMLEEISTTAL